MKKSLFLLLFPLALQAQKFQVYPGEYDNWVRHPKTKLLYNVVWSSTEPVTGIPAIADGEGKGSAMLHTAGFIGVDGYAYVWGDNACNISGTGSKLPALDMTKTPVGNARMIVGYANSGDGSGPGLGYGFAIVTNDNKLVLIGNTQSGFRGDGTEGNKAEPRPYRVTAIQKPILKVAAGSFIYVLYTDGTVDSWGGSKRPYWPTFCLGRGVNDPDPMRPGAMKFPEPIVDLSGGGDWTIFKGKSGALYGVAYNTRYLGVGPGVAGRNTPIPLPLGLPGNPVQIAVGSQANYALMANGDAYAWGDNTQAAIGNGKEAKFSNFAAPWNGGSLWVDKPVKINPPGVAFVKLFTSTGDAFYAVAEDRSGSLWVWGRNKGYVLWNGQGSPDANIQAQQPNRWDVLAPMKIEGFNRVPVPPPGGERKGVPGGVSPEGVGSTNGGSAVSGGSAAGGSAAGGSTVAAATVAGSRGTSPSGGTGSRKTSQAAASKGTPSGGAASRGSAAGMTGVLDTLVDVGGYSLHFVIYPGDGTPILFDAGGGEDASTWNKIIRPISLRTATTLITYDRAGFGRSGFDTTRHGILNGMIGLETGLKKLGYGGKILLVAHSQGGLYAQLYAARHPDDVKAAVLIDATTTCFYDPKRTAATQAQNNSNNTAALRASRPGVYFQMADFSNNLDYMRKFPFPTSIPVTDFVSDKTPFTDSGEAGDWKRCHQEFASAAANRTGVLATGTGHFIFNDDPALVINAIVRMYNDAARGQ